jgi:hypothetical protein
MKIAASLADVRIAARVHERFTYRMHDLGEFMKTFLQRFTRWFNVRHKRKGTLWESRFKSVIVQDGEASRTMAAYIDLNPVRAGLDGAQGVWAGCTPLGGSGIEELSDAFVDGGGRASCGARVCGRRA